jgi:quercetin dioxygenase-like cupin family protein
MTNTQTNITTVGDNEGKSLSFVSNKYRIVISGKQTGSSYASIYMLVPSEGGLGPHAHPVMPEIEFKMECGSYIAKKGSLVNIPLGGAVHSFKNITDTPAHMLCTAIPSGLDEFFQEIGNPVEAGKFLPPHVHDFEELQRLQAIAEKCEQKLYPLNYLD